MRSRDNALNQTEFNELLAACNHGKDKILVILCGGLGMRASEVSQLRDSWIDWQTCSIRIPSYEGSWTPKTESSIRAIPFKHMDRGRAIISQYFGVYTGTNITRVGIYKRIQRIAKRTKIQKKVTPHSLRATAASMFAECGLSAQALRQVMGWSRLETADRYITRSGRAAEMELEQNKAKLWI